MFTHEITEAAAVADEVGPLAATVGSSLGPMSATWWSAWARHMMHAEGWTGELRCIVIRDAERRMRAFLPYAVQAYRGVPLPSLAGNYFPFRCFVMDRDPAVVAELARALRRRFWAFRLGPCPHEDPGLRALIQELARSRRLLLERSAGTRFVLENAQQARAAGWPKASLLKRVQYYERRLAKRGELSFTTLPPQGAVGRAAFLARVGDVEKRSWVAGDQKGDLKIAPDGAMEFWNEVFADPAAAAVCRVALLTAGDQDVAFQLGLEYGVSKIIIANGYDHTMSDFNPGTVAVWRDIQEAIDRQVDRIDYGVGDGGYKQRWGFKPGGNLVDVLVICLPIPQSIARRLRGFGGFRVLDPGSWD